MAARSRSIIRSSKFRIAKTTIHMASMRAKDFKIRNLTLTILEKLRRVLGAPMNSETLHQVKSDIPRRLVLVFKEELQTHLQLRY